MRDRLPLLAFAFALLMGALAVLLLRAGSRGEFAEAFSTYRSEPDGARALFLLSQQAGLPVSRRHVDLESVEGTPELVLLGIEGDEPEKDDQPDGGGKGYDRWLRGRLDKYETDELLKAVDRGGTLIYAVTRDHPFLSDLGVTFTPAEDHASRTLTPFSPSPLTQGVHTLQTRISGYVTATGALPVLIDRHHDDRPVAIAFKRGQGRILVMAAPSMAANLELAQDDAGRFWLDVLGDLLPPQSAIEFDEYHHGFSGQRSVMGYASRYGLQWAIAQGIFALGLWSLALRRFGSGEALREENRRASTDYLLAMARIYRQGGHRGHVAKSLLRGVVRAFQTATRSPRTATLEQLAQTLEAQGHADLASGLGSLARQAAGPLTDAELLQLAQSAAALRGRAAAKSPQTSTPESPT